MAITRTVVGTATSDALVLAVGTSRVIATVLSSAKILKNTTRTVLSNSRIGNRHTVDLGSAAKIVLVNSVDLFSDSRIVVNSVDLKLFKQSAPSVEVGTASNPIVFDSAIAGDTTLHPDNPFLLYNDKTGSQDSVDAKNIAFEVLEMSIVQEEVGTSDGLASQVFSVAYPPIMQGDSKNAIQVFVGVVEWFEVSTFAGASNTDEVFVVDYSNGTVTFGDGVNGAIPAFGDTIFVTYTPNTATFGVEAEDGAWLGVQSIDTVSNPRVVTLVQSSVLDLAHVSLTHVPLLSVGGVQGVYLTSDPNRLATNYFTGGSYNAASGLVTLGTALPFGTTVVLVDYTYTILADAELSFYQLGEDVIHQFTNPIPSKNAKKINFQVVIPAAASPTNGVRVKFRLRVYYTEY